MIAGAPRSPQELPSCQQFVLPDFVAPVVPGDSRVGALHHEILRQLFSETGGQIGSRRPAVISTCTAGQSWLRRRFERDQRMHQHGAIDAPRALRTAPTQGCWRRSNSRAPQPTMRLSRVDLLGDEAASSSPSPGRGRPCRRRPSPVRWKKRSAPPSLTSPRGAIEMRLGHELAAEIDEVVLVAAGAVEQEEQRRAWAPPRPRRSDRLVRSSFQRLQCLLELGRADARAGAGSFSASPRCAVSSSRSKPGSLVAISNSTPPGVRK